MQFPMCFLLVLSFAQPDAEAQKQISSDVKALEQATLSYIESLGTDNEASAREEVDTRRKAVVSHGQRAINPVTKLLTHKQVNVRRGAAITLIIAVEKHGIDDEKLLDQVLLRMIEDPDIKCRSNLYHVVKAIVANIKKQKRPAKR